MRPRPEENVDVLVVGGGLAGLSAAYHLKGKTCKVVEREKEPGGTARSFKVGDFTFDFTGHLLHLHNPYTKRLVTSLLKNRFYSCIRKAAIFSHGTYTNYPFQANTHGLPSNVIDECILGFFKSLLRGISRRPKKNPDFHQWSLDIFGKGISKYFMVPYNQKLFQTSLKKMNVDWCGPFVPRPKLEDVIRGALVVQDKKFGYNTRFLYPKKGGIQELARAFGRRLKNLSLNTGIQSIDWKKRVAFLSTGERIRYKYLINTIPLYEFLKISKLLPKKVRRASRTLKKAGILCLNIGVRRPKISDKSWIYFPEKKYPFYRVGFPMNFTPHNVPRGCSSMYVEVPMNLAKKYSKSGILREVRKGLIACGILKSSDRLPVVQFLPIKYAYVIYDNFRAPALKTIFSFLMSHRIQSVGRYGGWKYSFMEEAILDGKRAAEKIHASGKQ